MDTESLIVGVVIGIVIALVWVSFSHRSTPKASAGDTRRMKASDSGNALTDADRRMAMGYFEDAARLVAAAIAAEPDRQELKYKLLEVYFIWDKEVEFAAVARQYQSDLKGSPEWAKIETMGQQLCPEDSMFTRSRDGAASQ